MYEVLQGQKQTGRHSFLFVGVSGLNVGKHLASEGYGFVVLEEGSIEAIFIDVSLQDKGLDVIIICQSGPERHFTIPGLLVVKSLICGGVPVQICFFSPRKVVLDGRPGEKGCK